jgi:preprotein translocase subunit SecF
VDNHSLMQTLARSLITSLTLLLAMLSLLLFGGITIRSFAIAVLIGVTSGTYSSIFNASMLLVEWEQRRSVSAPAYEVAQHGQRGPRPRLASS